MSRKMRNTNTGTVVTVHELIITKNGWEYFVLEEPKDGVANCLVCGFQDEMGDVYIPEILPFAIGRSKRIEDCLPAPEWEWAS